MSLGAIRPELGFESLASVARAKCQAVENDFDLRERCMITYALLITPLVCIGSVYERLTCKGDGLDPVRRGREGFDADWFLVWASLVRSVRLAHRIRLVGARASHAPPNARSSSPSTPSSWSPFFSRRTWTMTRGSAGFCRAREMLGFLFLGLQNGLSMRAQATLIAVVYAVRGGRCRLSRRKSMMQLHVGSPLHLRLSLSLFLGLPLSLLSPSDAVAAAAEQVAQASRERISQTRLGDERRSRQAEDVRDSGWRRRVIESEDHPPTFRPHSALLGQWRRAEAREPPADRHRAHVNPRRRPQE